MCAERAGPVVSLVKAYPFSPDLLPAQKTAGGTMPAAAFQYCEAMRSASSQGWYVFPPKDISLSFDGIETSYFDDGAWYPVKNEVFEEAFRSEWRARAPEALKENDPPFMSELFVPGHIQIWSGYFAESSPGWGLVLRPPINFGARTSYQVYEGIVWADQFRPMPLFINLKLLRTGAEIHIPADRPLFQIVPISREAFAAAETGQLETRSLTEAEDFDWEGVSGTIRIPEMSADRRPGEYAKKIRKGV